MNHSRRNSVVAAGLGAAIVAALVTGASGLVSTHASAGPEHPAATPSTTVRGGQLTPVTSELPSLTTVDPAATDTPAVPASTASPTDASGVAPAPSAPATTFTPGQVAPLTSLAAPDAIVDLPAAMTSAERAAVTAIPALHLVTVVSTGTVVVNGVERQALAVDPSTFRRVTPEPTAVSDALWASIAAGNLATEITRDALPTALVGKTLSVRARGTRQLRLGALAAFGLPGTSVVMSLSRGDQLGLAPETGLIVSAPTVSPATLVSELAAATGGHVTLLGPAAAAADIAGGTTARGLPATWDGLFQQAASTCPGLSWTVLAAIGQIESGDGQNDGPSSKGAVGPMQFLPGTFKEYAVDGDHDGKADPLDAYDAVPTAARMLCTDGAGSGPDGLRSAVFDYNHADWYVAEVLALAQRYR